MNIIDAIYRIVTIYNTELHRQGNTLNRVNQMGEVLEEWIKDVFANTLDCTDEENRLIKLNQIFSYLGNQNNPPDMILKNGDAIEVKKITSKNATLALNSSYPKNKLYANSPLITQACRTCESNWVEKDIIYTIGVVSGRQLKSLCMVYGNDYCASQDIYERVHNTVSLGVQNIPNIEFTKTNELAKIKKIDPLGITDLRVRSMWSITNPFRVFDYIYQRDNNSQFNFMCLINSQKYQSFDNIHLIEDLINQIEGFNIKDVYIKNPNNPAKLKQAKLITFKK